MRYITKEAGELGIIFDTVMEEVNDIIVCGCGKMAGDERHIPHIADCSTDPEAIKAATEYWAKMYNGAEEELSTITPEKREELGL